VAAGTLYVVATPIGNLGDVTFRALEVLRTVPLIAAEDTRVTRRLLDRYEITTRTTSYHAQSGPGRERALL
jgi:16S rRNA (cytidine1402-2'-O)-methyltransferase